MIFFSWGRRHRQARLPDGRYLVLIYQTFAIFWVFAVSWGARYEIRTPYPNGQWAVQPLTAQQAAESGVDKALPIGFWWRWGLLIAIGAGLAIALMSTLVSVLIGAR